METTIGIYANHELAVAAVVKLKEAGFSMDLLTIMGKGAEEAVDEDLNLIPQSPVKVAPLGAGTAIGTALGILTGVGIFAIPGVGFLYGAGALVGAIAGFDIGLLGGGLAAVLATIGIKNEHAQKYSDALNQGKFILIVHGDEADVTKAKAMLHSHGTFDEVA